MAPSFDEHARRTLIIASLATLATFLDTTILYVAFPDISATFADTDTTELSWILNAYTIVFAALLIPVGKLADRVGHRRVFLVGSAILIRVRGVSREAGVQESVAGRINRRLHPSSRRTEHCAHTITGVLEQPTTVRLDRGP